MSSLASNASSKVNTNKQLIDDMIRMATSMTKSGTSSIGQVHSPISRQSEQKAFSRSSPVNRVSMSEQSFSNSSLSIASDKKYVRKVSLGNGDSYEGEISNKMFNGKGTYNYRNGDKYVGDFEDNIKSGRGKLFICIKKIMN